ncbi:MAG: ABC transporter permease, partial [bacterium]|nr:ABC transporter permease [bacterium]
GWGGVRWAGRSGGELTAALGGMSARGQLDALRVMGADPIRHLVVPRFVACLVLAPCLTYFCVLMGSVAGWFIAVKLKGVPSDPYWHWTADAVQRWDMGVGFIKSLGFGGAIGLIACYKGFHCRQGAAGVGRACTEAFVASFIVILAVDFFLATFFQGLYKALYGFKSLVG